MFGKKAKKDLSYIISEMKSFLYDIDEKKHKLSVDQKIELALLYKEMSRIEKENGLGHRFIG